MLYKIDEVAKECGLTKRSIRYYEEIGLISPPERSEGGFRLYSDLHIERLKKIMNVRDVLGFSLQEVQEYMAIGEAFEEFRLQYRENKEKMNDDERKENLLGAEAILAQQLKMIDEKLKKMNDIRDEMNEMYQRVKNALEQ
ncbi:MULTISPECIES: MerR family transcriptional regulator [Bacillaceae]|uniref:MerR family transcriptional regulator n=1 Tax=Bacillaceae TaxID=186817 RepID=UPI000BEB9B7F|nr:MULTISPECIES: MerR family transcriptional regulator [unclassified Bacillus (in: firmicutes)]PEC50413.1 MerR family transcriptional regulator [Bacillus sp. AFS096315]PFM82055.1 MerR family transcriptional regulator [Bacillus sp. AFS077874]